MKSVAAIVLVIHVLLSTWAPGGLAELFRLPSLGHHYEQHFAESGGTMTWAEFLLLHYTDPEHEHQDSSRHGGLPFHHPVMACQCFIAPVGSALALNFNEIPVARTWMRLAEVGEWPARSVFHPPKA